MRPPIVEFVPQVDEEMREHTTPNEPANMATMQPAFGIIGTPPSFAQPGTHCSLEPVASAPSPP
jgi:hypothetical protein